MHSQLLVGYPHFSLFCLDQIYNFKFSKIKIQKANVSLINILYVRVKVLFFWANWYHITVYTLYDNEFLLFRN